MKSKFTLLILLLAVLASCKKTSNVDVTLSTSGKLTYKLLDDSGKGLPNVKVSLFDNISNYSNSAVLLDTRLTDQNGLADFGDLNPKSYLVIPDSPMVNNVKYNIQEYVQVVTGITKNKETKVSDYSGAFNITVKTYYNNNLPQKNMGILMIPSNKFSYGSSTVNYLSVAEYKGVTNDAGFVSFKVPSNKSYTIYMYNIITNASYGYSNYGTVQTNGTINVSLNAYVQ